MRNVKITVIADDTCGTTHIYNLPPCSSTCPRELERRIYNLIGKAGFIVDAAFILKKKDRLYVRAKGTALIPKKESPCPDWARGPIATWICRDLRYLHKTPSFKQGLCDILSERPYRNTGLNPEKRRDYFEGWTEGMRVESAAPERWKQL